MLRPPGPSPRPSESPRQQARSESLPASVHEKLAGGLSLAAKVGADPAAHSQSETAVEVGSVFAQELKSHLVSIESKVDEIALKVERSLGLTPRPQSLRISFSEAAGGENVPVVSRVSSQAASEAETQQSVTPRPNSSSVAWSSTAAARSELRRKSMQVMRRMSADLKGMGNIPGSVNGSEEEEEDENRRMSFTSSSSDPVMAMAGNDLEGSEEELDSSRRSKRRASVEAVQLGKLRSRMNWTPEPTPTIKSSLTSHISKRLTKSRTRDLEEARTSQLWQIVHGMPFQILTGSVIVLNAVYIGFRADMKLRAELAGQAEEPVMGYIELVFFTFFALELLLRLIAEQKLFLVGPEWKWNLFDALLVVFSFIDAVLNGVTAGGVGNVTTARMVRFVRFVRIIRIARAVRAFHSLRIVVFAIFESIVSLLWCFVVVFLIIYVVAVFFLQGVMEHVSGGETAEAETLLSLYGSLMRSMVTLFMTITGGLDWRDAMRPLQAIHWLYEPIFNFYVFFMVIGVLNVVVGAFVATTAEISSKDREVLVKAEMNNLDHYQRKIKTFFSEADKDKSGRLSWEEFKAHLKIPKVAAYFRSLELDVSQAHVVFKLLDNDGSNEVSLDEFVAGCMRLRGQAKSIDVNMLLYENKRLFNRLTEFIAFASEILVKDRELADVEQKQFLQAMIQKELV